MLRLVLCLILALAVPAAAQDLSGGGTLSDVPETVYGEPRLQTPGSGFNEGAVNLQLKALYATDYVFRGFEPVEPDSSEDALNFGFDGTLSFDLGRLPDPYVRLVTNSAEGDSISNFQVFRPLVGLVFANDAFDLNVGHQGFTYPDRDGLDTGEIFAEFHFNDAVLGGEQGRVLGPYVFAAYDYDTFEGTYIEGGLRRFEKVGESSVWLGYDAHVAYVDRLQGLFGGDGSGFQHWQVGVNARYDLNTLLNLSRRFGRWSVEGQINYTDGIDDDLAAETQLWGGGGIVFRY